MTWAKGAEEIEELIGSRRLQRLRAASLGAEAMVSRARRQLVSAALLAADDPATSYVIAYDAAKHAAMALLAAQDLRATAEGGHVVLERALAAQFGGTFDAFGRLRRRRNELDYPTGPEDTATSAETERAIEQATSIVDSAATLLEQGVLDSF